MLLSNMLLTSLEYPLPWGDFRGFIVNLWAVGGLFLHRKAEALHSSHDAVFTWSIYLNFYPSKK